MYSEKVIDLMNNAALLLAMGCVYNILSLQRQSRYRTAFEVAGGVLVGGIAIVLMATPVRWGFGAMFDIRSVVMGLTGLFFGVVPTAAAVMTATIYTVGTDGSETGMWIATMVSSGLIGLVWRHYRMAGRERLSVVELYLFGAVVHMAMLVCILLLPAGLMAAFTIDRALPVIVVCPVLTAVMGALLAARPATPSPELP